MNYILSIIVLFLFYTSQAQEVSFASDFEMELLDQSKAHLYDYQGKIVYISFWASWCKPCISNYRKYADVRDRLEAEGVVLLNVSIDKSKDSWLASVETQDINGIHALAIKEDLYPDYQISSIPLYEIVGKQGQFLYLSDESNRDVIGQFKDWVKSVE